MKFKPLSLASIIIFGSGVATGGLLGPHLHHARPRLQRRQPSVNENRPVGLRPPEILSQTFLRKLDENLQLTSGQHDAIQKIMSDGQNQIRKVVQDSRLEIREALTPSQRLRFDSLVKRPFHKPIFATNGPPALTTALQ